MKKLSFIVLIAALVLCFTVAASAELTITVGDVQVESGTTTATVPISLSGNEAGLAAITIKVSYPVVEDLVIKSVSKGGDFSDMTFASPKNDALLVNPLQIGLDAEEASMSNGTMFNVTFQIPAGAKNVDYEINVSSYSIVDDNFKPCEATIVPGKISVVAPAEPLTNPGVALLLDGSIGVKFVVEYDEELVEAINLNAVITDADKDSPAEETIPFELKDGVASAVVYVPAKDIDNITIAATAEAEGYEAVDFGTVTVPAYVDQLEELAEEIPAYARALDVVHAMETYCAYADNYFNEGDLESIVLNSTEESAIATLADPGKAPAEITSLKFYASSLILEGRVTLRHYFRVKGQDFNLDDYTVTGGTALQYAEGTTNFVYTDIENVAASELSRQKTVVVAKGDETIAVRFAALNYVALVIEDEEEDDVRLIDLAKALYRYSVAADNYANEIGLGDNEMGNQEW